MFFSDKIVMRLQASVTTPWDFKGGGMYWGIGTSGAGEEPILLLIFPLHTWNYRLV